MAHIRREFFEAKSNDDTRANTTLTLIQQLYKVEQEARELQLSAEERGKLRLEKSTGPFSEFKKWCIDEYQKVLPQSAMGKVIAYALRRMDNLALHLVHGDIEIDNNLVETSSVPLPSASKTTCSQEVTKPLNALPCFTASSPCANTIRSTPKNGSKMCSTGLLLQNPRNYHNSCRLFGNLRSDKGSERELRKMGLLGGLPPAFA